MKCSMANIMGSIICELSVRRDVSDLSNDFESEGKYERVRRRRSGAKQNVLGSFPSLCERIRFVQK